MIKFFRHIRKQLLSQNRFTKYLFYAIGEIVLVVVGILLALQVNNWNENRANEKRFVKILKEMRRDLETDINRSIGVLSRGKEMDSLVALVLDGNLTKEDYLKKENRKLLWVGLQFSPFDYQKTAFNKFENFNNVIPEKFDIIISSINNYYNSTGKLYDDLYQNFRQQIKDRHDYLANNQSWYHLLRMGKTTDEMVDFYLKNVIYKNWIVQHKVDNTSSNKYGLVNDLQLSAFGLVTKISDLLGDSYKLKNSKLLKKYGQPIFEEESWTGTYEESDKDITILSKRSGYLFMNDYLLTRKSKDTLFFNLFVNWRIVADRDKSDRIKGLKLINLKDSTQNDYAKKID